MSKAASKDDQYYTPKYVYDFFTGGNCDYDPATNEYKAKEFGIPNYDTIETDGLKSDWTKYKKIWINPPFTRKFEFLGKAAYTYKAVQNEIYVLIPIESITTKAFYNLNCKFELYIPNGRINFTSGRGKQTKSPSFGSIILKFSEENSIKYVDLNSIKVQASFTDKVTPEFEERCYKINYTYAKHQKISQHKVYKITNTLT